jgi:hypothetical protein
MTPSSALTFLDCLAGWCTREEEIRERKLAAPPRVPAPGHIFFENRNDAPILAALLGAIWPSLSTLMVAGEQRRAPANHTITEIKSTRFSDEDQPSNKWQKTAVTQSANRIGRQTPTTTYSR